MSANSTKVAEIKDMLASVAEHDLKHILATQKAMDRMNVLGVSQMQVRDWLTLEPYDGSDGLFHGFASRQQASLAAFGSTRKSDQPAAYGAAQDRVNTLIKVQVPEKAAQTIGLAIVSIPAQSALPPAEETVKRFRRLPDGRMREIRGRDDDDSIEVDAEPVESPYTMKRAERK